jgi:hypothetical protein
MRSILTRSIVAFVALFSAPAFAQSAPDAATAFAERSALVAAANRCRLLTPDEALALQAGAQQARGALLRGGWDGARVQALAERAVAAASRRACDDAALLQAVAQAQAGYAAWSRMPAMQFQGAVGAWAASRAPDAEGWLLRQNGRAGAVLGVRMGEDGPVVAFSAPLSANSPEPAFAVISYRDGQRARVSLVDLPGRPGAGLQALAAPPTMARQVWAQERQVIASEDGRRTALLTFPANAFEGVGALDPREAIEVRIGRAGSDQGVRLYFEVGDLAAAQAFLAARPPPAPTRPAPPRPPQS